jgi:hypothetical protein
VKTRSGSLPILATRNELLFGCTVAPLSVLLCQLFHHVSLFIVVQTPTLGLFPGIRERLHEARTTGNHCSSPDDGIGADDSTS